MKNKEQIDELYHKCWDDFINKYDDNLHYYSFVEGYTQCQEDMDKKYTEEDVREAIRRTITYLATLSETGKFHSGNIIEEAIIQSLNGQA